MPALSFQEERLDKLLSGTKQQTTRPQTDRIKEGDVVHIYNQQRKQIIGKRLRSLTDAGYGKMTQLSHRSQLNYPAVPFTNPIRQYPAHFLGKVLITEVYDMRHPIGRFPIGLEEWALKDGFDTYLQADDWFTKRYGSHWLYQNWTVIKWQGWQERYFEPEV